MTVIDVHTHMLNQEWLDILNQHGGDKYSVKPTKAGQNSLHMYGTPFMTLMPEMFDYEARIKDMDKAGVDVAIVSLTCPSASVGPADVSLRAAKSVNDSMAEQQDRYPDRIRWFAALPWQYEREALGELKRTVEAGAVGVFVSANIDEENLTSPRFKPVWDEIDRLGLPVLIHPTAPQGVSQMNMNEYGLVPPVGFVFDTTLAVSRMIFDGFFDRYQKVKVIASHGGGTLPYIAGRLDRCHEMIPACRDVIKEKPSSYLKRIYYDTVVYEKGALDLCIDVAGTDERVLYGSDYPHNIGDMVGCLARVDALSPGTAKKVRGHNALAVFNL